MMSETKGPGQIDETPEILRTPPFVPFLRRAMAFLVDCVALFLVFMMLRKVAEPALREMNPLTPWLGHALMIVYFWLGNGPVGKGRTLGKSVFMMQTVDGHGNPLGWKPALIRAVMQHGCLLMVVDPILLSLLFPTPMYRSVFLFLIVAITFGLAFMIVNILSVGIHPFKQALHDVFANSYVTSDPAPGIFYETLNSELDILAQRKLANHMKITMLLLSIFWLVLSFFPLSTVLSRDYLWFSEIQRDLNRIEERGGYEFVTVAMPNRAFVEAFEKDVRMTQAQFRQKGEPVPTTGTLRAYRVVDGNVLFANALKKSGAVEESEITAESLPVLGEAVRGKLYAEYLARQKELGTAGGEPLPEASEFVMLVGDYLHLPFSFGIGNKSRIRLSGPANPEDGAIVVEKFAPPEFVTIPKEERAGGGDRPTTATLPLREGGSGGEE